MKQSMPRLYFAQSLIDEWLTHQQAELKGDILRISLDSGDIELFINPAVYFEQIDGTESDVYDVVGRVKTSQELAQMGADHYETSVVIADHAYTVKPGFTAVVVDQQGQIQNLDEAQWHKLVAHLEAVSQHSYANSSG